LKKKEKKGETKFKKPTQVEKNFLLGSSRDRRRRRRRNSTASYRFQQAYLHRDIWIRGKLLDLWYKLDGIPKAHTHTLAAASSYSSIRARSAIYTQTQAKEQQQQQHHLTPLNSHLWMSTISNVYFEGGKKERKNEKENGKFFFRFSSARESRGMNININAREREEP
jgi:hypothetical protein